MTDLALIPASDDQLPDHLQPLTDMQRAFVANYVSNGGKSSKAAIKAGYSPTSAHVTASRMLRLATVNRAIIAETSLRLGHLAPSAVKAIGKLVLSAKSEYVQLQASQDVLDRIGLTAPKRVDVQGSISFQIDMG